MAAKEDRGPGLVPVYHQYTAPPPVLNTRGHLQYQMPAHASAAVAEAEKEKMEDVASDTGYDTPGIPKEFLNVSLQQPECLSSIV